MRRTRWSGESLAGEPWKGHRISSRRVDGIHRRDGRRTVVRVIHAAARVDYDFRISAYHGIGLEGPDLADEHLPQGQIICQGAVGLMQECHARIADYRCREPLFFFTRQGELHRIEFGILAAGVARRAAHQPAFRARLDPCRGGSCRPEVGVVGMADDNHESTGSPGVVVHDLTHALASIYLEMLLSKRTTKRLFYS